MRIDFSTKVSQFTNMAKRPRKPREGQYEAYRQASGWYLAAWRDRRGLTLEELAGEVGTSKGVVSDLETGARRSSGALAQRFNRDDVDHFARALGVTGGFLIDVNPYALPVETADLGGKIQALSPADRQVVEDLTNRLLKRG
jgi:transcriptional regulator with XRE-family HTH domain